MFLSLKVQGVKRSHQVEVSAKFKIYGHILTRILVIGQAVLKFAKRSMFIIKRPNVMKIFASLLLTLLLFSGFSGDKNLHGRWQLEKIEMDSLIMKPYMVKYYLDISKNKITYNLDANRVDGDKLSIEDGIIDYQTHKMTDICCDGKYDTLAKFIDYRGAYILNDSSMVISNEQGKYFLKKAGH
jgi:hypothetical protein